MTRHLYLVRPRRAARDPTDSVLDAQAYRVIRARPGIAFAALAELLNVTEAEARAAAARLAARGRLMDATAAQVDR